MSRKAPRAKLDKAIDGAIQKWKRLRFPTPAERNKARKSYQASAEQRASALRAAAGVIASIIEEGHRLWPRTTMLVSYPVKANEPENVLPRLGSEIEYAARAIDREARLSKPRHGRPQANDAKLLVGWIAKACEGCGLQFTDAGNGEAALILRRAFVQAGLGELSPSALRPYLRYGRSAQQGTPKPTSKNPPRKRG